MEILVCIKQVTDDSVEIFMNEKTGKPALESVEKVVNAFDTYALEMATRLKETKGDTTISVLSLGGEDVTNSLKNCLAVGADEAFYVKDEAYQEKDAVIVAQALDKAIKNIEEKRAKKFDVIFCGKETTDFATGQVGIMLADELNYGVVTNLVDIDTEGEKVIAKKETETGYEKVEVASPCIVTVNKPNYEPRYPTIKSKMAARKKAIAEISIEVANESAVKEVKLFSPPKRQAGVKIKTGTAEELVAQAIQKMLEAKVF